MMKFLQITMFSLAVFIAVNCQKSSDDINGDEEIEIIQDNTFKEIEIIQDNTFEKGFALTPLDPKIVQQGGGFEKTYLDTLDFGRDGSAPIWRIAQWHSKFSLSDAELSTGSEGSFYYVDEGGSKKVTLYPDNSLLLELNASKVYDRPRVSGEKWPHLLIAQDFNENSPNVGKARKLLFSMELKLEKEENKMDQGTFITSLHTAHSPFFFVVRNNNKNSPDFNQRIWFGIRSYDYRRTELSDTENIHWDIGTSTFIYGVPPRSIWGEISFQDKKWHKGEADLKPLIIRALQAMREKDVFKATTPDDLVITGMNFGWEIPGTFDAAIRVKGISLKYIE